LKFPVLLFHLRQYKKYAILLQVAINSALMLVVDISNIGDTMESIPALE
jgi:hypothetical protein